MLSTFWKNINITKPIKMTCISPKIYLFLYLAILSDSFTPFLYLGLNNNRNTFFFYIYDYIDL